MFYLVVVTKMRFGQKFTCVVLMSIDLPSILLMCFVCTFVAGFEKDRMLFGVVGSFIERLQRSLRCALSLLWT